MSHRGHSLIVGSTHVVEDEHCVLSWQSTDPSWWGDKTQQEEAAADKAEANARRAASCTRYWDERRKAQDAALDEIAAARRAAGIPDKASRLKEHLAKKAARLQLRKIGWRIRTARHWKKLTLRKLAEAIGSSEQYVCAIQTGRAPGDRLLPLIAEVLGVSVEWLRGGASSSTE